MKATAVAPANIAFIKYWGKADEVLRLPLNSSFSMNLSGAFTATTVEFSPSYKRDDVSLQDGTFSSKEIKRVTEALDGIRKRAGAKQYARVVTKNTFPKSIGAAASASGFAALTLAACSALGLTLSEKELTILARLGSGSACRSIPDGFVVWEKGNSSDTSYAYSLYPHTYWDLCDVLVIVDATVKKISTSDGQKGVTTSPFLKERTLGIPEKIERMKAIFQKKDFPMLGNLIEEDCLSMHHVMQTQNPTVMYWSDATKKIMESVRSWRDEGIAVYFTIDAGPNVHLICEKQTVERVMKKLADMEELQHIIVNTPAPGAHLINQHIW